MARAKTSEPSRVRSKAATIEELIRGARELQEFLAQVEDLGREGFPYLDAARARTELQFRECIRRTFGEKSQEFQKHRHHRLPMDSPEETRQSVDLIKSLIAALEQKKIDLQGGPPLQQISAPPAAPPMATRPQMTIGPASISTVQMTLTQTGPIKPPPGAVAVAMTTNLDLAPVTTVSNPPSVPPVSLASSQKPEPLSRSTFPLEPLQVPSAPTTTAMPHTPPQPVAPVAPEPQSTPQAAQPAKADVSSAGAPSESETGPNVHPIPSADTQLKMQEAPPVPPNLQPHPPMPISFFSAKESSSQCVQTGPNSVECLKTICCRFHYVARQLRLRGEYRTTLSVEDEVDAQDLLHALLRIEFDNIDTDEWTPSYSGGAPRTTLLLNESRLAVIVKKTRPGLTVKDLTDQLRIDAARYRSHGRCTTLLCFMYDPDGRIGNPQGLEASLTSVHDSFVVEVLVAPK